MRLCVCANWLRQRQLQLSVSERHAVEEKPLQEPRTWLKRLKKEKTDGIDSLSTENLGCRLQRSIVFFSGH